MQRCIKFSIKKQAVPPRKFDYAQKENNKRRLILIIHAFKIQYFMIITEFLVFIYICSIFLFKSKNIIDDYSFVKFKLLL